MASSSRKGLNIYSVDHNSYRRHLFISGPLSRCGSEAKDTHIYS